jgi:hypothetical protein
LELVGDMRNYRKLTAKQGDFFFCLEDTRGRLQRRQGENFVHFAWFGEPWTTKGIISIKFDLIYFAQWFQKKIEM